MFDRKRMEKALKESPIKIPKGLSREQLRRFIVSGGRQHG